MIHPTRTNLLLLKDRARSVCSSVAILKARKQAMIKEFLEATRPFLRSREDIRSLFGKALLELWLSMGHEGSDVIESVSLASARDFAVDIIERNVWGLKYKDVITYENPVREPDERGYDYLSTTPHLEECARYFEKLIEAMIKIAEFESKLKIIGAGILITGRKIRVLEELVYPGLARQIRSIAQSISERERETYFRLKRFKEMEPGRARAGRRTNREAFQK